MESLRVYYVERQRLVAADLQSEQEYLAGLDERHNLSQHAPGIVRGLRIGADNAHRYVVEPGLAIDSFGRELALRKPESIIIDDANQCADVWLIYCRQEIRLRQPGRSPCSPNSFQRLSEIPRVFVVLTEKERAPEPPADGAVFLGRINPSDSPPIAYTALHGGEVADPGGRALMQVGPRTGWDKYGFMVSVADAAGNLIRRIALDRRGNNSLYGTIELLEYRASRIVSVLNNSVQLIVEARRAGTDGEDIQVKLEESKTSGGETIATLTFLNSSSETGQPPSEKLTLSAVPADRAKALEEFNKNSQLVTVKVVARLPPQKDDALLPETRDDRPLALSLGGGMLKLDAWPTKATPQNDLRTGCYEPSPRANLDDGNEPNGLSFLPLPEPPKGAPTPGIYRVPSPSGDSTVDQLRFDLGEKKDADDSVRFSLGEWSGPNKKLSPWLTISGNCLFTLIGGDTSDPQNPPISFNVTGSIEQSPIKPDPTDPEFKDLLVNAWVEGLQSSISASTIIDITFEGLPNLIETRRPWQYTVRLTNKESKEVVSDKVLETRSIAGQTILNNLRTLISIPGNNSKTILVEHERGEIPAGDLTIEVRATGKVGSFPWWKSNTTDPITVVETPQVILTNLPDEAPPSLEWIHSVTVKNADTQRRLTLKEVSYTEGVNPPASLAGTPVDLAPQQTARFDVPHPGGVTSNLNVAVLARYQWVNGPEDTITELKVIEVARQLNVDSTTPSDINVSTPWTFELKFRNVSSKSLPLTINSLEQRLRIGGDPPLPFESIIFAPVQLQRRESFIADHISGIPVPAGAASVRVEVRATYEREGRTWEQLHTSDEIAVNDVA
jgi:hypothetical protein